MHNVLQAKSALNDKTPATDIEIIDQIGDALKDARRYYSRCPTDEFESLIEELEAAERLHKAGILPHDIAIRHLRNHADYLEENGSEARAIELRKLIEDQSIEENL